jgi:hypothetical protein
VKRENFNARGSVTKILCTVARGRQLSLLCLRIKRYGNLFPFKLFEFIHEEEDDKIEAPVLMEIHGPLYHGSD